MTKEQTLKEIAELKEKAEKIKEEVDFYNAMQNALKLVLNGSYGAFANSYFVLYNNNVASTITAQGRDLTQTMDRVNQEYWYQKWHLDTELHRKLCIKNPRQIPNTPGNEVSIYADTDSVFVSFQPVIAHCEWQNLFFDNLDKLKKDHIILWGSSQPKPTSYTKLSTQNLEEFDEFVSQNRSVGIIIDGVWAKNRKLIEILEKHSISNDVRWNWSTELDFIHGIDQFRYAGYFSDELKNYADSFGVDNRQDFELERISESIINVAKKKYIQHIVYEDGINYDRFKYIFPKGVELVRSSTPLFARDKIVDIIKYLFQNPDSFNIKELLKLVKNLKREFDLCAPDRIDDICMQSSCSSYEKKVLEDKTSLKFESGTHFAVKASAYYNYLLHQNRDHQVKYEFIKSGTKIKYYYVKNKAMNEVFAYIRGAYPIEFAPEIDLDEQFNKSILSPINSIIEPLNMPQITKRLSVIVDIFS
jgi:DNA polymerase elongation subunit (family B)